jgi:K+-sensing histidine kinase KdpD
MTAWWLTASIRVRLTAWYAAALALMLVVYAAATRAAIQHEFFQQFDDQLHEDFERRDAAARGSGWRIAIWAVEINGGRISVEDGATSGSVFRIVLPLHAASIKAAFDHTTQPMGEHV